MITIPRSVCILIGSTPIDMRKSIDGLLAIVHQELQEDAYSGHLFVFVAAPAQFGVVARWATASAERLDCSERFLKHLDGVLDGRPVERRRRWTSLSSHVRADYHETRSAQPARLRATSVG